MNQHNAARPTAQIEKYIAGSVEFNLLTTDIGTTFNDIMTGWRNADSLSGGEGDDYLSGGRKGDILSGDAGNDILFGDNGYDSLYGGADTDILFGGNGNDRLRGGAGDDRLEGGDGKDVLRGNDDQDQLYGGNQDDRLFGGQGDDLLSGDAGNDTLKGGKGGDHYVFDTAQAGAELIIDKGNADSRYGYISRNKDVVRLDGFASYDVGIHSIQIDISGDDLVISYANTTLSPGVTGQITIRDHFLGHKFAMERLTFGAHTTALSLNISYLSGDDYTYSVHGGSDVGGNDLVLGTVGDDQIYGGIGSDVMLGGGGADAFMFHDEEDNRGGVDLILDFNLADDILDFTEIKTLTRADLTISENSYGNVVISSAYGVIELNGISQAEITDGIFVFL